MPMYPRPAELPLLYTIKQATQLLNMCDASVLHMIRDGKIQITRPYKAPRIPHSEIVTVHGLSGSP